MSRAEVAKLSGLLCVLAAEVWPLTVAAQTGEPQAGQDTTPSNPPQPPLQVVVQGHRPGTLRSSERDVSAASTVIPERRLENPGATAAAVLRSSPGAQLNIGGASSDLSTASIRGATSAQTPVYLAGIRLNDDTTGTADLSTIPLWMLRQVEIFRGNAPGEADQPGIGGAIFFEPKLPRSSGLRAGVSVGSFGSLSQWIAGTIKRKSTADDAKSASMVALRVDRADNDYLYRDIWHLTPDATEKRLSPRSNADFTSYDVWSVGLYELSGGGRFFVLGNAYDREQGITGLLTAPAEHARSRQQRFLSAVSARAPCASPPPGSEAAGCRYSIETTTSVLIGRTTLNDPYRELYTLTTSFASQGERVSERILIRASPSGNVQLGVTASQTFERLRVDQAGLASTRAGRNESRHVALMHWRVKDWLDIHGLGGLDLHMTRGSSADASSVSVSPTGRLGVRVRPIDHDIRLDVLINAGYYARVPTLAELYGLSPFIRGNPELVRETGPTVDLGLRVKGTNVVCNKCEMFLETFGFVRWASNLIGYKRASFGIIRPFNITSTRVYGVEMLTTAELSRLLVLELSATWMNPHNSVNEVTQRSTFIPFRSEWIVSPGVEVFKDLTIPDLPLDRASLGVRFHYQSWQAADPAGGIVLPARHLLDLNASVRLFHDQLTIRGSINNTLNEEITDIVGLPAPGRNVHMSFEGTW